MGRGRWQPLPGLHLRYQMERAEAEARQAGQPWPEGLAQSFEANASAEGLAAAQFEIAQSILPFKRLGVLVASRHPETLTARLEFVRQLGKTAGLRVETCVVHDDQLHDDLTRCLKTLPEQAQVQALMLAYFDELSLLDTPAMERALRAVSLPAFALSAAGTHAMPPGLALFVDEVGRQSDFDSTVKTIERMLPRQAVGRVIGRLLTLPTVKVDLQRLRSLGHPISPALLNLFPQRCPQWTPPHSHRSKRPVCVPTSHRPWPARWMPARHRQTARGLLRWVLRPHRWLAQRCHFPALLNGKPCQL